MLTNFNKYKLNNYNYAICVAFLALNLVLYYFLAFVHELTTGGVFIILTSFAELVFLLMYFYQYAHITAFVYAAMLFALISSQNYDLICVIDYANFAFSNVI